MSIKGILKLTATGCVLFTALINIAAVQAAELPELANPSTASGVPTTASYYGGATADGGSTYQNNFSPDEVLDILSEIHVESGHVATVGNLYVVATSGELMYMRDTSGAFIDWSGDVGTLIPTTSNKPLSPIEPISIVEGLAFSAVGVTDADVFIYLAYDTLQNPGELYYSGSPISLTIGEGGSQIDTFALFVDNISQPIIQSKCVVCHISGGIAGASQLVYVTSSESGYQQTNFNVLTNYILNVPGGSDLILSKPQGVAHGGGEQLSGQSAEFLDLTEFVEATLSNAGNGNQQSVFSDVLNLDQESTLRKAAMLFAGRLPTVEEYDAVAGADDQVLRQKIRDLMQGDGFNQYLLESANDRLLTQAFSTNLFGVVNRFRYPESMQYYLTGPNTPGSDRRLTSEAIAAEPLQLISHVVSNELPYTEVLTADYIMVNPWSAEIFGGNVNFNNPLDPNEWREGEITEYYRCTICAQNGFGLFNIPTDYPHAGLLNSPAFLARFPSTSTNRNRARARWAYYFFLGVDIEGLSERTTDPDALADEDNPTLNNPNCTVCHNIMDPVAGAFQNYGDDGFYRDKPGGNHSLPASYRNDDSGLFQPGDTWYADMLLPGFGTEIAPNPDNSLQWLAQMITTDNRFGYGTANFWYPSLMGREPLPLPENPEDVDYLAKVEVYSEEQQMLLATASDFIAGTHGNGAFNLKDLLADLAMSNFFRAAATSSLTKEQLIQLEEVGIGKLLTPEQLNRKLIETTGFEWSYGRFNTLIEVYRLTYGGIDSFGITERAPELTTLMSTVVTAMANETSCAITAQDFGKPQGQRLLFPDVELSTLPTSNPDAIKSNIQYLHERLLGEILLLDDPEIAATFSLFEETWNARVNSGKGDQVSSAIELCILENAVNPVTVDPNQTLRSWAVVVNYLMRDYKFIHE